MAKFPEYTMEQLHMFDDLPSAVLIQADNGHGGLKYAYSNHFFAESLGYTHEELAALLTANPFAAIFEADQEKAKNARTSVAEGKIVDSISRQKKKDGSYMWILAHIRQISLDGKTGMLFLFSRIQELIGLQDELSAQNKEWSDILGSVPIGLLVYKEEKGVRTTLSINSFLLELANSLSNQLDPLHKPWTKAELSMIFNKDIYAFCDNEDIPLVEEMLENSKAAPIADCMFRLHGSNKAAPIYIYSTCASKSNGPDSRTYYVIYQDMTESENRRLELLEKQDQLYRLSYFDALTGVKNRNAYNNFSEYCKKNRIRNTGFAFCDINGLKKTNDTLGHTYGDKLIRHFSAIVTDYFDPNCIYRISGDEFVIICQGIEKDAFLSRMTALTSRVEEENCIASIGYIWKEDVSDIPRRTTQAEEIMYVEKQRYYEASRTISSKHRPQLLDTLLRDFEENRFVMYLQPKTSIDGSTVFGAEALVRRTDDEGNVTLPYAFVPQLEQERLIAKLDYFMLDQACAFLQNQHLLGNNTFSLSVNMSRVTVAENEFIQTVSSILHKYDFDRNNLELELTESNKTLDSLRLEEYISKLKALGLKLSLDDMGTDYSTLTLLTMDGLDWVKLDRSLIIQLDHTKSKILVKHIINTCHDLNLKVIAEGVETDAVRELLKGMGCDAYQGYLKSKPIPAAAFSEKFL